MNNIYCSGNNNAKNVKNVAWNMRNVNKSLAIAQPTAAKMNGSGFFVIDNGENNRRNDRIRNVQSARKYKEKMPDRHSETGPPLTSTNGYRRGPSYALQNHKSRTQQPFSNFSRHASYNSNSNSTTQIVNYNRHNQRADDYKQKPHTRTHTRTRTRSRSRSDDYYYRKRKYNNSQIIPYHERTYKSDENRQNDENRRRRHQKYCQDYHYRDRNCHRRNNNHRHHDSHRNRHRNRHRNPQRNPQRNHKRHKSLSLSGSSDDYDDTIGEFESKVNDTIYNEIANIRYIIKKNSGRGTFGKVLTCYNPKNNQIFAVKIIRKIKRYIDAAKIEAKIIYDINNKEKILNNALLNNRSDTTSAHDTNQKQFESHCVKLYSNFLYNGYMCLVFEQLGLSLYEFMKLNRNCYKKYHLDNHINNSNNSLQLCNQCNKNNLTQLCNQCIKNNPSHLCSQCNKFPTRWGFPLIPFIKSFTKQMLEALSFLHEHCKLTHTDLKPENILLYNNSVIQGKMLGDENSNKNYISYPINAKIKLIDFGGATYENNNNNSTNNSSSDKKITMKKSTIICTRQYRGPEVILELGKLDILLFFIFYFIFYFFFLGWTYSADMWSLGCILSELYTGNLLFQTHHDVEHLGLMEKILQKNLPKNLLKNISHYDKRTKKFNKFKYISKEAGILKFSKHTTNTKSISYVKNHKTLKEIIYNRWKMSHLYTVGKTTDEYKRDDKIIYTKNEQKYTGTILDIHSNDVKNGLYYTISIDSSSPPREIQTNSCRLSKYNKDDERPKEYDDFYNLIAQMLNMNPYDRITATQGLLHFFVK